MKVFLFMASTGIETAPPSMAAYIEEVIAGGYLSPYLLSILLGIVEGLTEFLPVSSTAHLRIAEALMRLPSRTIPTGRCTPSSSRWAPSSPFACLFLERIVDFIRTFPRGENGERNWFNHPISLTFFAFVCTSVLALALRKWSEKNLGSLTAMAIALLAGGIVMWIIDAWAPAMNRTPRT